MFSKHFLWNFLQKHEKHSPQRMWIPEASCLYSSWGLFPVWLSTTICLPLALTHCTIGHLSGCGKEGLMGWFSRNAHVCVHAVVSVSRLYLWGEGSCRTKGRGKSPLSLPLLNCTLLSYRDLAFTCYSYFYHGLHLALFSSYSFHSVKLLIFISSFQCCNNFVTHHNLILLLG